jgi:hypothetical protein
MRKLFTAGLVVLTLAGCSQTQRGAAIGGVGGAAVGALVAGSVGGVVVGGVVGATAGAIIAD